MAKNTAGYNEDTISAQYMDLILSGISTDPIGGVQSVSLRQTDPARLIGATDRKVRFQKTDVSGVAWRAQRLVIRGNTFYDLMKGQGLTKDQYGNFPWGQLIFDMEEQFNESNDVGITSGHGGWVVHYARLTDYYIGHNTPFELVMEEISGIAVAMYQKDFGS